jgi:hypothetical protein
MSERYSVYQFFVDGSYERVSHAVGAEEAVKVFRFYTNNVATQLGVVRRVIITDWGDCISAEWQYGRGLTFPIQETTSGTTH